MELVPFMKQWGMLPAAGERLLCAVSGGRDSICLLHYLNDIAPRYGFTVAAGHLNHLMRPEAARDEAFVRCFCAERGIPFYTEAVPVYEKAEEWHITVEEAGRRARYEFLKATAERMGAARIATAHHQKDLAETVVLNLLRGTGPEGLAGIPPVRGLYVRPLLHTSRQEIEAYLAENHLGHVEDSTNTDTEYARNRLRLRIWPLLETINSAAAEHIAAAAMLTRRENDYLNQEAEKRLPREGTAIRCDRLKSAPEVLQRRMVRLLLSRIPAGKKDVSAVHVEGLLRLADMGGCLSLPGQMQACCRDGVLTLYVTASPPEPLTLTAGEQVWGSYLVTLSDAPTEGAISCPSGELTVRSWRSADRLTLPGSRGERSLKRLFAEAGVPVEKRDRVPVLCRDGKPVAVPGIGAETLRADAQYPLRYVTFTNLP